MKDVKITDVRVLPGDSAFLIDDGDAAVLYDTGFAFTGGRVAENVKNALGGRTLDYIFLTHSHYDHALGAPYVKRAYPGAVVVAHEYAAKVFAKESARATMRRLDKGYAEQCGAARYEDLIDALSVDRTVTDGDRIRAGGMEFTVVELPGHTKCSVGFYLEKAGLLLGSETLGVYCGTCVVPSYLVGCGMTLRSIEKAEKLGASRILAPHYGLLEGKAAADYLKMGRDSAVSVAEELAKLMKKGGTDEEAFAFFKDKYYKGAVVDAYPLDAMTLNTSIMVKLIRAELV